MNQRHTYAALLSAILLTALFAVFLTGCAGGRTAPPSGRVGRAVITVNWPPRPSARLIPAAANSIRLRIVRGGALLGQTVLARPTDAGGLASASFDRLPVGDGIVSATAFPNSDGTGTSQADASTPVTITAGETASVRLTMASTIATVAVAAPTSLNVGGSATAVATAEDGTGAVILTAPGAFAWSSSDPAVATADADGALRAVKAGTATIRATETESGVSGAATVTVGGSSAQPGNVYAVVQTPGQATYFLREYTASGTIVRSVPIPAVSDVTGPCGLIVASDHKVLIFNAPFDSRLSVWDPATDTWQHHAVDGLSIAARVMYGDVATNGKYAYLTDMETAYGGAPRGIVRYDLSNDTWQRFADDKDFIYLAMGWDGKLYGIQGINDSGTVIHVYDPDTMNETRQIVLSEWLVSLAVNRAGTLYGSEGLSGRVFTYTPDGTLQATHQFQTGAYGIYGLQLDRNGVLTMGSGGGFINMTDETFANVTTIDTGMWNTWATSMAPGP